MTKRLHLPFLVTCGVGCWLVPVHAITLEAALTRTLEKNPSILQAKAQLERASGRRLVLRSLGFRDARLQIPGGLQGGKRAGEDPVQPFAFARGSLTQPLFHAGLPATYRRGDTEVLLAQQRLNVAVMDQLHLARVSFYTAAYQDSLRALGESQRERLEGNVRTQTDRYQAGQTERGAVTVARLLEEELLPRIEQSRRVSGAALLKLSETMGEDLGAGGKALTTEGSLQFAQTQIDFDAIAASALRDRPDLKLARLLVRAASEDQRIIEAEFYPAISGGLSGDYIPFSDVRRGAAGSGRRSDDIVSSELRAGAAYTWRVIDNGRVLGAVRRQRAVKEMNELVLAKLEAAVPRELARIQNNLRALAARQKALDRATVVAEQTVSDVLNNLSEGLSSQLEYRTAENSFLQTKAGLLAVAFDQNMALAEFDRVTGRYFQFSEDTNAKVH